MAVDKFIILSVGPSTEQSESTPNMNIRSVPGMECVYYVGSL